MIGWGIYVVAISAALGLAALALEKALDVYGRATRWAWTVAMLGTVTIPAALGLANRLAPEGAGTAGIAVRAPLVGAVVRRLPEAATRFDAGPALLAGWGAASLLALLVVVRSARILARERRGWRSVDVAGTRVLESDALGPAVVGVLRMRIAVPGWIHDLDEDLQALAIAHERSHRTAADPRLLWFGLALCVAVPWCAPLWWELRRLRLAIEVDCDRRVLAGGAAISRYGSLLLEVGRRSTGGAFALVGLFEPRSFLERRIRVMTKSPPRHRFALATGLALCAIPILGLAAALPVPTTPSESAGGIAIPASSATVVDTPPHFSNTPFTDPPTCLEGCSPEAVMAAFTALGMETPSCHAVVGLRISDSGEVTATDILKTGGARCDEGVRRWAAGTRWSPAERDGAKVEAWIAQPVRAGT